MRFRNHAALPHFSREPPAPRFLKSGFPSARFCSETDFCPLAVLIAAQIECCRV